MNTQITVETFKASLHNNIPETIAHMDRVKDMLANGQSIIIVRDNDNEAYESGWADFLMNNYNYTNLNDAFRVNLEKPKP